MANAMPYVADRSRFVSALSGVATSPKQDGDLMHTQGRGAVGDGGHASYRYRQTGKSGVTTDEGHIVSLGAGDDYLENLDQTIANIRQFGAHPDNTASQNTTAIQSALDTCSNVYIPPGIYECNGLTVANSETHLYGAGRSSILLMQEDDAALLDMQASFCDVHRIALKNDGASDAIGLRITDCTRSMFSNMQIGASGNGFEIGITCNADPAYGGTSRNWINTFQNNQIQGNTIGILRLGHSCNVTGGEIQAGRHGILQCLIDEDYNPDLTDTTSGNLGSSIRIRDTAIEGMSYDAGVSYGIVVKMSQNFPIVEGVYFEAIGTGATGSKANGVAIQANYSTAGSYYAFGGKVNNCYFGDIPIGVKIGRVDGLEISSNYATNQGSGYYLIDASDHSAGSSYLSIHDNRCDDSHYITDPSSKLQNSYLSASNVSGDRGGSNKVYNDLTFITAPVITFQDVPLAAESSDCKHRVLTISQTFATSYTGKHFYIRMTGAGVLSGQLNWTAVGQGSSYVGAAGRVDLLAVKENGSDSGDAARNGTLSTSSNVTQPVAPTGATGLPTGTMSVTTNNAGDDSYSDIELNLTTAATGVATVSQISGTLAYAGTGACAIYDKDGTLLYTVK